MPKVYLSWDDVEKLCKDVSDKIIESHFNASIIVSIGRGGMIPSRLISDLLNINNIVLYGIKVYSAISSKLGQPQVMPFTSNIRDHNVLLIDDLADSGQTFDIINAEISQRSPKAVRSACLLCKQRAKRKPTFYSVDCPDEDWIVFPWEKKEFCMED